MSAPMPRESPLVAGVVLLSLLFGAWAYVWAFSRFIWWVAR